MDDEAVSHYCCHLLCGGWGITAAGAKGCVHPPSPYDCSSQVVAKDDDDGEGCGSGWRFDRLAVVSGLQT